MMRWLDADKVASRLTEYYGLPLAGRAGQSAEGSPYVEVSPQGVHENDSYRVRIVIGWRSLRGVFIPGAFASQMIADMGRASHADKTVFAELVSRIQEEKGIVDMQVNGVAVDPVNFDDWPADWERLSLVMEKSPLAVNTEDRPETDDALFRWGGRFFAAILALTPLEEINADEDVNPEGLPEGAKTRVEVNKYERNRFNRAACIEIHGDTCKACGFDFGRVYGDLGKGYIQVHHLTPVSELGPDYKINPAHDLIPLCANCHAMVHKRVPPLDVHELIGVIERELSPRS